LFTLLILLTRCHIAASSSHSTHRLNGAPPTFIVEIPVDSATKPIRKRSLGAKAELVRQLIGADGVPPIVPGAILDRQQAISVASKVRQFAGSFLSETLSTHETL